MQNQRGALLLEIVLYVLATLFVIAFSSFTIFALRGIFGGVFDLFAILAALVGLILRNAWTSWKVGRFQLSVSLLLAYLAIAGLLMWRLSTPYWEWLNHHTIPMDLTIEDSRTGQIVSEAIVTIDDRNWIDERSRVVQHGSGDMRINFMARWHGKEFFLGRSIQPDLSGVEIEVAAKGFAPFKAELLEVTTSEADANPVVCVVRLLRREQAVAED